MKTISSATQQTHTYTDTQQQYNPPHARSDSRRSPAKTNKTKTASRTAFVIDMQQAFAAARMLQITTNIHTYPWHTHRYTYNPQLVNNFEIRNSRRLQVWIVSDRYAHATRVAFRFTCTVYVCVRMCVSFGDSAGCPVGACVAVSADCSNQLLNVCRPYWMSKIIDVTVVCRTVALGLSSSFTCGRFSFYLPNLLVK